jgi:hypothetical protein
MKGELIADAVCDVAEHVARREFSTGGTEPGALCRGSSSPTGEAHHMQEFNEKDAGNLQKLKDAMAEKALGGGPLSGPDAAAAAAFAALLEAETNREALRLKHPERDKPAAAAAPAASWQETVTGKGGADSALAA